MGMRVGDWVKIIGTSGNKDRIGYILETTDFGRYTIVQTVPWVEYAVAKLTQYRGSLELLDEGEVGEVEIDYLIDMALSTRDEEWFMELTSKLKREK